MHHGPAAQFAQRFTPVVFAAGVAGQFIQPGGNHGAGEGLNKAVFQQRAGKPGGFTGQGVGDIAADGQYPLRLLLLWFRQLCPQPWPVQPMMYTVIGQLGLNLLPMGIEGGGQHKARAPVQKERLI